MFSLFETLSWLVNLIHLIVFGSVKYVNLQQTKDIKRKIYLFPAMLNSISYLYPNVWTWVHIRVHISKYDGKIIANLNQSMSNKVYKFQDLWRHGWILLPYEAFSQICLPLFLKILKRTFSEVAGSLSDCFGDGRLARNIRISFAGNFIFLVSKTFKNAKFSHLLWSTLFLL